MKQGLVSIIIPCYKNFDGIYKTLDSIFKQTYSNIEIIINDDGSPNFEEHQSDIENYLREKSTSNITNIVVNHLEKNVGTSKNCNAGIALANGEYVKLLTADDEFYDDKVLESCVSYMNENNGRILVGQTFVKRRTGEDTDTVEQTMKYRWQARSGRMCNIVPPTRDIKYLKSLSQKKQNEILMSRCIISTISVFFRMDLLKETDGFIEKYRLIEDMTYWPHIAKKGEKFLFADIIMVKYSLNGISNGGPLNEEFRRDYMSIMKNIYIENEVRGGIFNTAFKCLRKKEVEWFYDGVEHSFRNRFRYMDVAVYSFYNNLKYLFLGTKL